MKIGSQYIHEERIVQFSKGYDSDHDDAHDDGSLADLAAWLTRDSLNQVALATLGILSR